ncbi:hypothetical protein BKA69DRAFT_1038595 [Paraphysoderma sedebokerense]|nr:hypothetical protein BKA69DRAFT_1038595 [Paraphysoderma sedebokerense]
MMIKASVLVLCLALASGIRALPQLYVPPQYATGPSPGDDKPVPISIPPTPQLPAAKPSEFRYVTPPPPSSAAAPARKPASPAPASARNPTAPARNPTTPAASRPRAQPK